MRHSTECAIYETDSLPGCSQVAVSHSMFIRLEHRNKGHAVDELMHRLYKIKVLGYDYVICTVDLTNEKEIKTIKKMCFRELDTFVSQKTGHKVGIFGRRIEETHSPYDLNPKTNRPYWED